MREVSKLTTRLFKFDSWKEVKRFVDKGNLVKVFIDGLYYAIDECDAYEEDNGDDGEVCSIHATMPIDEQTEDSRFFEPEELNLDDVVGAVYEGYDDAHYKYAGYDF